MKKLSFAVCLLILALGMSGCSVQMSDISEQATKLHNIIVATPEDSSQVDPIAPPSEEVDTDTNTKVEESIQDETLKEAAEKLTTSEDEVAKEDENNNEKTPEEKMLSLEEILADNQLQFKTAVTDRLMNYVQMDTTSDSKSETAPSTAGELLFAQTIVGELQKVGLEDAYVDEYGYVYATIPANVDGEPIIGIITHMDTTEKIPGKDIKATIIEKYDGKDITREETGIILSTETYTGMKDFIGDDIIISDGTTLLGADGKAGIAEVVTLAEFLLKYPEIAHGQINIAVFPDHETGYGTEFFNSENFGADFAYTLDGGRIEEGVRYETFNKANVSIIVNGVAAFAGEAKGLMKNALAIAAEFASMLPDETPGNTSGYEGYYYVDNLTGTVTEANLNMEICDFDNTKFETRKAMVTSIAAYLNGRYGDGTVEIVIEDCFPNMANAMGESWDVVSRAMSAMSDVGYEKLTTPLRDTTDGSVLTVLGLPTPNLPVGETNQGTINECVSINEMTDMVNVLINLVVPAE